MPTSGGTTFRSTRDGNPSFSWMTADGVFTEPVGISRNNNLGCPVNHVQDLGQFGGVNASSSPARASPNWFVGAAKLACPSRRPTGRCDCISSWNRPTCLGFSFRLEPVQNSGNTWPSVSTNERPAELVGQL